MAPMPRNDRQTNRPRTNVRRATVIKGGTGELRLSSKSLGDKVSKMLRRVTARHGNDALSEELTKSNRKRDAMLAFIMNRLQVMQETQKKELHAINDRERWFRQVFRGHQGETLPDTTRWHDSAGKYKKAMEAICRGHLGRGLQLMEQAIEAERAAFDSLPIYVQQQLERGTGRLPQSPASGRPPEADTIGATEVCPQSAIHAGIRQLANRILAMESQAPLVGWRARKPHKWWVEEEEDEENKEKKGDAKS